MEFNSGFKGLNAELNPICHLLALLGVHHFLHVSRIRVKSCIHRTNRYAAWQRLCLHCNVFTTQPNSFLEVRWLAEVVCIFQAAELGERQLVRNNTSRSINILIRYQVHQAECCK